MNIILLGAPGSGKGTQASYISKALDIPKISTGDMLRTAVSESTELGQKAKQYMDQGALVPDELIIEMVKERIRQDDCFSGFILDGFPRTLDQAKSLAVAGVDIQWVILLDVPDEEIVKRITGRRVHAPSGRVYHLEYHPPQQESKDDITGEALVQRDDDREETVRHRLKVYKEQCMPVIEHYKISSEKDLLTFMTVNGLQPVPLVREQILHQLQKDSGKKISG